jgi:ribonuclease HII
MTGRTWKKLPPPTLSLIKNKLMEMGAQLLPIKNIHEVWRLQIADSTFTAYKSGTLYSTPSQSHDSAVEEGWQIIDNLTGTGYSQSTRNFLIGLDETGKGEIAGPIILAGVIFPSNLFDKIVSVIGPADTKKQHELNYWKLLAKKLIDLSEIGFSYQVEYLSPILSDRYNTNRLFDLFYKRLINSLIKNYPDQNFRIVLDDYGTGMYINDFFHDLIKKGNEGIIISQAEEKFIEVKAASLLSKYIREHILYEINNHDGYNIKGLSIGNGNLGNQQTIKWLKLWYNENKEWPWFIKKSFKPVLEMEGKKTTIKKRHPEINKELISEELLHAFNHGEVAIQSLWFHCPACQKKIKFIEYNIKEFKCPNCETPFNEVPFLLSYFCNSLVLTPDVVEKRVLSRDLSNNQFFENFQIIIDKTSIEKMSGLLVTRELKNIKEYQYMHRIKLLSPDSQVDDYQISKRFKTGNKFISLALQYNSILLTSLKELIEAATEEKIFTIYYNTI